MAPLSVCKWRLFISMTSSHSASSPEPGSAHHHNRYRPSNPRSEFCHSPLLSSSRPHIADRSFRCCTCLSFICTPTSVSVIDPAFLPHMLARLDALAEIRSETKSIPYLPLNTAHHNSASMKFYLKCLPIAYAYCKIMSTKSQFTAL